MPNGLAIAGGVTFPILAPDGSALAPSYSFTNFATAGMYAFGGGVGLSYGGLRASITALGVVINSGQLLGWAPGGAGSPADVILTRDAADVLAQRNSTNAQAFRVYNTYTDASNYERLTLLWSGNSAYLQTEAAGTGAPRDLVVGPGGNAALRLQSVGSDRWSVSTSGHFLAAADNTYDIGASGNFRPRNVYVVVSVTNAGNYLGDGDVRAGVAGAFYWTGGDASIWRLAAASIRLGGAPSATPVAQTFTIGEASRPGTDTNVGGASGTIRSGLGTGTGTTSSLIFQTPDLVASGSTTQTYSTRWTIGTTVLTPTVPIITTAIPGTVAAPAFGTNNGGGGVCGMYEGSGPTFCITVAGGFVAGFRNRVNGVIPGGLLLRSDTLFGWTSTSGDSETSDLGMARLGAAYLRQGLAPSATPVAQTFALGESSRGTTDNNVAGANGTLRCGAGTGNAAGASLIFETPTPTASGVVAQAYAQRLSLSVLGATFDIPDQGLRINNQVNGAGAGAGTLTNAPAAGNPTFWLPINVAGTVRFCPLW